MLYSGMQFRTLLSYITSQSNARSAAYLAKHWSPSGVASNLFPSSNFVKNWRSKVNSEEMGLFLSINYPKASSRQYIKSLQAESITEGLPKLHYEDSTGWSFKSFYENCKILILQGAGTGDTFLGARAIHFGGF